MYKYKKICTFLYLQNIKYFIKLNLYKVGVSVWVIDSLIYQPVPYLDNL